MTDSELMYAASEALSMYVPQTYWDTDMKKLTKALSHRAKEIENERLGTNRSKN